MGLIRQTPWPPVTSFWVPASYGQQPSLCRSEPCSSASLPTLYPTHRYNRAQGSQGPPGTRGPWRQFPAPCLDPAWRETPCLSWKCIPVRQQLCSSSSRSVTMWTCCLIGSQTLGCSQSRPSRSTLALGKWKTLCGAMGMLHMPLFTGRWVTHTASCVGPVGSTDPLKY